MVTELVPYVCVAGLKSLSELDTKVVWDAAVSFVKTLLDWGWLNGPVLESLTAVGSATTLTVSVAVTVNFWLSVT